MEAQLWDNQQKLQGMWKIFKRGTIRLQTTLVREQDKSRHSRIKSNNKMVENENVPLLFICSDLDRIHSVHCERIRMYFGAASANL